MSLGNLGGWQGLSRGVSRCKPAKRRGNSMKTIRPIGLPTLLASLAVVASASPGAASAATTVGRSGTGTPSCYFGTTTAALQDPAWGAQPAAYTVPFDGVITSFTAGNSVPPDGNQIKLLILEPVSGSTYKVVAKSEPAIFNVVANGRQTFPIRIAVQAGQLIGDYGKVCIFPGHDGGPDSDIVRLGGSEPTTGAEQDFAGTFSGFVLDLSASLEADADRDGFGDETQDCPTNATTAGPCPPAAAPTGQRAAAQQKCKKNLRKGHRRRKCIKRAKKLPV